MFAIARKVLVMANSIAETLSNAGCLTVLDGPLHDSRHRRGLAIIGYVKTHHRRMFAREYWVRVPELTPGGGRGRPSCGLAGGLRVGAAPGRAGPDEPDADRGSPNGTRIAARATRALALALRAVRETVLERNREGRAV